MTCVPLIPSTMASLKKKSKRPTKEAKYRKPEGCPKRFKSAYMFYSERKHKEFRRLDEYKKMRTADVAKLVSRAWKALPSNERLVFLELASKDKERYEIEKANYKGPWKVLVEDKESSSHSSQVSLDSTSEASRNVTETGVPLLAHGGISESGLPIVRPHDGSVGQGYLYQKQEAVVSPSLTEYPSSQSSECIPSGTSMPATAAAAHREDRVAQTLYNAGERKSTIQISEAQRSLVPTNEYRHEMSEMEMPGNLDGPYLLSPLIPTDTGSFLAAAAMYDDIFGGIFE